MAEAKTILAVDDNDSVLQLARTVLFMEGYTVILGCSGEDALYVNANHPNPIDLLLTDIRMGPRLNGCDLAGAMRDLRPGIKVVYMSAFTEDDRVIREVSAGKAGFIRKPFTPSELLARVAHALSGKELPAPLR